MALERNFITPADVVILTTANVVGNTASTDMFANTVYANTAPSLRLDFAKSRVLDPRVTFFRNSIATYEDDRGIIRTVSNNQPRFNFSNGVCEGLMVEESKTNIWLNEFFEYGRSAVTAGTSIGPDGKAAFKYTIPRGVFHTFQGWAWGGGNLIANNTLGATTDFTFTGYFGPSSGSIPLRSDRVFAASNSTGGVSYCECIVNGDTGTFDVYYATPPFTNLVIPTATRHVNGMWKVRWTVRLTADSSLKNLVSTGAQIRSVGGATFFTSDGVSSIEFCCGQVEQNSEPSSYIPTGATAVTRDNEWAVMDGANFAEFYNPQQGTIFAEGREYISSVNRAVYTISDGGTSGGNTAYQGWIAGGPLIGGETFNNGPAVMQAFVAKTSGATFKIAQSFNSSNVMFYHNGTAVANYAIAPANNFPKSVDRLIISSSRFTNGYFPSGVLNGTIKRLYFYKNALTPEQHALITS